MHGALIHLTLHVFLTLPAEPFTVSIRAAKEICIILQLNLSNFIDVEDLPSCTCTEIRVFGCKDVYLPVCPLSQSVCVTASKKKLMNISVH